MKKILCYGDSNTFGFNPADFSRYDENHRWSGILKTLLKDDYEVIEEGKNNRTGVADNPDGFEYSAQKHFPKYLSGSCKIDTLILALGSNDLQKSFNLTLRNIERGIETLISIAKSHKIQNIILVPPVELNKNILKGFFKCQFDETSIFKSRQTCDIYKNLAKVLNCKYFDFNEITRPSEIDGLHYTEEAHALIAENLAKFIKNEVSNEYTEQKQPRNRAMA